MKHGWENFTHEILLDNLTKAEACAAETELIATLKSNDDRYGYNLTTGGEGCPGFEKTEEYRQRQSAKVWELWQNPEYRAHMSEVHKGKRQSAETIERRRKALIGRQVSEKTIQKMRERMLGNKNRARAVLCIETGEKFSAIKEAAAWAGITPSVLNRLLLGRGKSAGGYHWRYIKED